MLRKVLMLLLMLLVLWGAAMAEETPDPFDAYFTKTAFVRPNPAPSSESLASIPEMTLVHLEPINDRYARVTYDGRTGYVYYAEACPIWRTCPRASTSSASRQTVRLRC